MEIHYLSEQHILIFLVQIALLLLLAKTMGALFHAVRLPSLAGEILVGVLLGPTLLGRLLPEAQGFLFPAETIQMNMLETVSWLGVMFLLLVTGFEVSIGSAVKQGKAAIIIGVVGVALPLALGMAVFWWLPADLYGNAANRLTFSLFLATTGSISAIAVIARLLYDMEIIKSDLGLTILSGFIVNDLLGWIVFSVVLGLVSDTHGSLLHTGIAVLSIIAFGAVSLTVGSRLLSLVCRRLRQSTLPQPATTLTLIGIVGMASGAFTQAIGLHAILGFFIAGIMAGNAKDITEREKEIISQTVHAIFVPIFFASIGIKVDFIQHFDWFLVAVFTGVATGGKFFGAWIAALMSRLPKREALSVGIAFIPGGAMEIIVGILALELQIISLTVFVAIVVAALFSSVMVGPLLSWSVNRGRATGPAQRYFSMENIVSDLGEATRSDAIAALVDRVVAANPKLQRDLVIRTVNEREALMGTGLEKGVAVPHGRLDSLTNPLVAMGISRKGIDWDTRDGLPVRFVFLILTPADDQGAQLQLLGSICDTMRNPDLQQSLLGQDSPSAIHQTLLRHLK